MYEGIRLRNLSCPAVSQSCNLTCISIVFGKCFKEGKLWAYGSVFQVHGFGQEIYADSCLIGVVETVVHEPGDQ